MSTCASTTFPTHTTRPDRKSPIAVHSTMHAPLAFELGFHVPTPPASAVVDLRRIDRLGSLCVRVVCLDHSCNWKDVCFFIYCNSQKPKEQRTTLYRPNYKSRSRCISEP